MSVLVLLDHHDGRLRPSALELLTLARGLPGEEVHAVWIGPDPDLAACSAQAVLNLHHVTIVGADAFLTAPVVDGLEAVLRVVDPSLVLVSSTFEGKEVASRLGLRTGAGVVTGARAVERTGEGWVAHKMVLAGTWNTACEVKDRLAIMAVLPNAVSAQTPADRAETTLVPHLVHASPQAQAITVESRRPRTRSARPTLVEAEVVVVGGRGTGGDFSLIEELADTLGGAVGASRVAVDEGWIGHEAQVGQTGTTINPRLYIGAGVSGAVHHRGGMDASATVVAVNADPEAPMFGFADYGIVGDLKVVLPAVIEELKRRR